MIVLAVLAAAAAVLGSVSLLGARPPTEPVPDLDGYLARWAPLHGGYDPRTGSVWLRAWLAFTHRLARPLARRGVPPAALTAWTTWLALAALALAHAGGRWAVLAGLVVVLSGLGDSLDGCVALLTGRATRFGYVLDSAVDRVNDVVYLVAVAAVGGAQAAAVAAGAGMFLLEYVRARGANAGAGDLVTVTVAERGQRVALLAVSLVAAGVLVDRAALVATAGLALRTALTAVALVQLVVALRRLLADAPGGAGRG